MTERSTQVSYGSIGFFDLLFLVFLVLKLTNVIDWSWWWVTAPLWGPLCLVLGLFSIIGILYCIYLLLYRF